MPFITTRDGVRLNVDHIVCYGSRTDGSSTSIVLSTDSGRGGTPVDIPDTPEQLDALIRDAVRAEAEMISLVRLEAMDSHDFPGERRCRVCGCTDDHACDGGCHWVEPDLCSACADPPQISEGLPFNSRLRPILVLDYLPDAADLPVRGELIGPQRTWSVAAQDFAGATSFAMRHCTTPPFVALSERASAQRAIETAQGSGHASPSPMGRGTGEAGGVG